MKKSFSLLLTLLTLVSILALGTAPASAVSVTDSAFTDNYVLLDYIQNTDGQYINTGYNAGANVTVTMDLEITAWNHRYGSIFGSRSSNHATNSFVMCRNDYNDGELRTEIGNANYTKPSVRLNTRTTQSLSGSSKFSGTGLEIYLFGLNENNAVEKSWGIATYKLYSCKITDNGAVVRDFVPAQRKSDSTVGLYDLQNDKFYESASGTGFAMTEEHTAHTFDKDGKCICGAEFGDGDWGYSRVSFQDCDRILVVFRGKYSGDSSSYLGITDMSGEKRYEWVEDGDGHITNRYVDGNTVMISDVSSSRMSWTVFPLYESNKTEVKPTCTENGSDIYTYCGKNRTFITEALGHCFDKNGICTNCKAKYIDKNNNYEHVTFSNCDKIGIEFCGKCSYSKNVRGSIYVQITDGNGKTISSKICDNKDVITTIYVEGNTAIVVPDYSGRLDWTVFPVYGNTTASVLSEGNIWIIAAVAVVAFGGVGTIVAVKKKKKPAVVNAAKTTNKPKHKKGVLVDMRNRIARTLYVVVAIECMMSVSSIPTYAIQHKERMSSTLSEGNIWIVIPIIVLAAVGITVLKVVRRKPIAKTSEENENKTEDEE